MIYQLDSHEFKSYGKIITDINFKKALEYLDNTNMPSANNLYVSKDTNLEQLLDKEYIQNKYYGGLEVQVGYCNGYADKMNGIEYHMGSEILIAKTDLVLFLGHHYDIVDETYDSSLSKAFYIKANTCIEIFSNVLHLSPIKVNEEGYKAIIILLEGTNTPIDFEKKGLLLEKNKWVLITNDALGLKQKGAKVGIKQNRGI